MKLWSKIKRAGANAAGPERLFIAAFLLLIAVCVAGCVASFRAHGFGSDTAAWVQAAGSIAAIAGAVWISSAEGRRQRKHRRREREEVAFAVCFSIKLARNEASTIAYELVDGAAALASEGGRHWQTRCRNAVRLLQHYASRTDHLHPAIVQEANNALLLMEELEGDIGRAAEYLNRNELPPAKLATDVAWYEIQLNGLVLRVEDRIRLVGEALDEGGDWLPWIRAEAQK